MTREERCKLAIERGFTYDPETGIIYGSKGFIINNKDKNGYIIISFILNEKHYNLFSHQFAWYWVNKKVVEQIDHINGVRNDNRICNLRSVSNQQNQWNRNTAKGYSWDKSRNKWRARIGLNGKTITIGRFNNEEDARAAYLEAKEKYHII
jgi:hypothetical protein